MTVRLPALAALSLLLLGLLLVVSPSPAWACSCVGGDVDSRADLIVTGTVLDVSDSDISLGVESVTKGSASGTISLDVARSSASCGYEFETGARYRVNAIDGHTGLCVGVQPLPPGDPRAPEAALPGSGEAGTPLTGAAPPLVDEPARDESAIVLTAVGTGLAALAVAGLGVLVWRRRRSG